MPGRAASRSRFTAGSTVSRTGCFAIWTSASTAPTGFCLQRRPEPTRRLPPFPDSKRKGRIAYGVQSGPRYPSETAQVLWIDCHPEDDDERTRQCRREGEIGRQLGADERLDERVARIPEVAGARRH